MLFCFMPNMCAVVYRSTQACMRFELYHSIAINVIIMDLMLCFWCDSKITYIFFFFYKFTYLFTEWKFCSSSSHLVLLNVRGCVIFLLFCFEHSLRSGIIVECVCVCVYTLACSRWIVRLIVNSIIIAMIEHQIKAF